MAETRVGGAGAAAGAAPVYVGIDVGTGGVRAVAVTLDGELVAQANTDLPPSPPCAIEAGHEQDPASWWSCVCATTKSLVGDLRGGHEIRGLAVDGTSGTLVCLDASGEPLRPALMYNDGRAREQAEALNATAADFTHRLGYRFEASFALAKLLWVREKEPEIFARTRHCAHQADLVAGRLTGRWNVSDYSNALKTGYDLLEECWPAWLDHWDGVRERLPDIVAPGTQLGEVTAAATAQTGLPTGTPVIAGASDGTAACLASGLRRPGDYNTTLGTTLTFKGISTSPCRHPDGLVYSHKLPGGHWLPGAASNTGAEWIGVDFPGADLAQLDRQASSRLPMSEATYPLARTGERFPFRDPEATGFGLPASAPAADRFAANLQGTALVERLAYAVLDEVAASGGGSTRGDVFATGGGSRSDVWLQCRADVTGRAYHRPACPESAFGSAVLAAAGTEVGDVWQAVATMVRQVAHFEPRADHRAAYDAAYGQLLTRLREHGAID